MSPISYAPFPTGWAKDGIEDDIARAAAILSDPLMRMLDFDIARHNLRVGIYTTGKLCISGDMSVFYEDTRGIIVYRDILVQDIDMSRILAQTQELENGFKFSQQKTLLQTLQGQLQPGDIQATTNKEKEKGRYQWLENE